MNFSLFKKAVSAQIDRMVASGSPLLVVDINPYELTERYQAAFPEGSNPIFREKREHDCNCCNSFIRKIGRVVALVDGKKETIWSNIHTGESGYDAVAAALDAHIKSLDIVNVLRLEETNVVGTDFNFDNETEQKWEHFYHVMPEAYVVSGTNHPLNLVLNHYTALTNSLAVDLGALDLVMDLAESGSLYRGTEKVEMLKAWKRLIVEQHNNVAGEFSKWSTAMLLKEGCNFRGSAIGKLIDNLSKGDDLTVAVNKYGDMVDPANYKHSSKVVTSGMIKEARKKVEALGMEPSLERVHAKIDDLTINNVLFADRSAAKKMGAFDILEQSVTKPLAANQPKIQIGMEEFISTVIGSASAVEMYVEPKHTNNLFTLVAPVHDDAPNMLKWNNNFSWSYINNLTDSNIRERVSKAGGEVDCPLRVSLAWGNKDDLDIHVTSAGEHISYSHKSGYRTGGELDVDMNYGGNYNAVDPVENVRWVKTPENVSFTVEVHNMSGYCSNSSFELEIAYEGQTYRCRYPNHLKHQMTALAFIVQEGELKVTNLHPHMEVVEGHQEMWDIRTGNFHKVNLAMLSPNYWDEQTMGNKHFMFAIEGCKNPEPVRGFFNEFLANELHSSRKVFEVLGNQMKAPYQENQVSGVGFSSTIKNSAIFKVSDADSTKLYEVTING